MLSHHGLGGVACPAYAECAKRSADRRRTNSGSRDNPDAGRTSTVGRGPKETDSAVDEQCSPAG